MLRGDYPELLRFAQDRSKWSERAQHDRYGETFIPIGGPKARVTLGRQVRAYVTGAAL